MQTNKEGSTREDLSRRACDAERARDDALLKLDAAHNEQRRQDIACVSLWNLRFGPVAV